MVTMTMHVDEAFSEALRIRAREDGKSVNQLLKDLLSPLLGLPKERTIEKPWMKLAGSCPDIDEAKWQKILDDNRQIDREAWK